MVDGVDLREGDVLDDVELVDDLLELSLRGILAKRAHDGFEFFGADFAINVLIL